MGGGRERDLSHTLADAIGDVPDAGDAGSGEFGGGSGGSARGGYPSTPGADAESARASAGAPAVQVPDESVGGPSVARTGVDSVGDVVESQGSHATAGTGAPSSSAAAPGSLDTDAIRRAWPTVLGRIFTMRRLTWTFVSQNAQVMGFDGRTLTLGIATAGLTTTFRSGNHSEVVRQALIDELGVDAVVDGVHVEDIAQQPASAPPAGAVRPESDTPPSAGGGQGQSPQQTARPEAGPHGGVPGKHSDGGGGSWGDAGAGHDPRGASRVSAGHASSGVDVAAAGLSPVSPRSLQDNAGWGSPAGPAPDWATAPADDSSMAPASSAGPAAAESSAGADARHARGVSAVRQSFAAARSASAHREAAAGGAPGGTRDEHADPIAPATDDSAVSDDDEDIEQSGDVGRTVIEKVLGGRVVSETVD